MRVNKKSEKVGLKYSFKKNQYHSIWPHHFMTNRWGNSDRLYFLGHPLWVVTEAMKLKDACSLEGRL